MTCLALYVHTKSYSCYGYVRTGKDINNISNDWIYTRVTALSSMAALSGFPLLAPFVFVFSL